MWSTSTPPASNHLALNLLRSDHPQAGLSKKSVNSVNQYNQFNQLNHFNYFFPAPITPCSTRHVLCPSLLSHVNISWGMTTTRDPIQSTVLLALFYSAHLHSAVTVTPSTITPAQVFLSDFGCVQVFLSDPRFPVNIVLADIHARTKTNAWSCSQLESKCVFLQFQIAMLMGPESSSTSVNFV